LDLFSAKTLLRTAAWAAVMAVCAFLRPLIRHELSSGTVWVVGALWIAFLPIGLGFFRPNRPVPTLKIRVFSVAAAVCGVGFLAWYSAYMLR
jgi:hypothetical protein